MLFKFKCKLCSLSTASFKNNSFFGNNYKVYALFSCALPVMFMVYIYLTNPNTLICAHFTNRSYLLSEHHAPITIYFSLDAFHGQSIDLNVMHYILCCRGRSGQWSWRGHNRRRAGVHKLKNWWRLQYPTS